MLSDRRHSIKWRLIAIQIVTSLVVILLFAVTYIIFEVSDYKKSVKAELESVADIIGYNSISAIYFMDMEAATKTLKAIENKSMVLNVWIIDTTGSLFAHYSKPGFAQYGFPYYKDEIFEVSNDHIIYSNKILNGNEYVGMLHFRLANTRFRSKIITIILIALAAVIVGMIITFLMASFTQRSISNPLVYLTSIFDRIKDTKDFSVKIKRQTNDEIGILYEGFNDLIGEVNNYKENLEGIVLERTSKLEFTNKQLIETKEAVESTNLALKREIEERKKADEELKTSEEKLRIIMDTMEEGVIVYTDEEIKFVNSAFCRLIGYSPDEMIGSDSGEFTLKIIHPEDVQMIDDAVDKCFSDGALASHEYRYIHKSGEIVWVFGTPAVIPWEDEDAIIATVFDVTEHKKDKEDLRKAKEAAEAANRAKSSFLANMSHEIRTPMNAVLGYSQILQRDKMLNQEQINYVRAINKSGEHLLTLINDVLDMSKIEAGRVKLLPVSFNIHELVKDMISMFRIGVAEKNLILTSAVNRNVPVFIFADQGRVRQIIINLMGNAIKFSGHGQVNLKLELKSSRMIACSVSDQGVGIPEDMYEKIFEPFEQTEKGINLSGGTGLGLAISRKLARLMDGDITVKSMIGIGSTFEFTFKFEPGISHDIAIKRFPKKVLGLKKGTTGIKILVVDDKELNRNVLLTLLGSLGFSLKSAENGLQGVEIFKNGNRM
nr:PAS domain S-box protein [Bacteroidota bacterium]